MAEGQLPTFDLEDVIIDDATWDGNNIVVKVVDQNPQQQEAGGETVTDAALHEHQDTAATTTDQEENQAETTGRIIDELATMDVLQYVDQSKNHNTRSAEKAVS